MGDPRRTSGIETRHRVIVASASAEARRLITTVLESHGLAVTEAHDGEELHALITSVDIGFFRVVVAEQQMPRMSAAEVVARSGTRVQFVVMTGETTAELRAVQERYGVATVLGRPLDVPSLVELVLDLAECTPALLPGRRRAVRG